MNAKELFKNITDATYVVIGVLVVKVIGKLMIKKNKIYYYKYYCLIENKNKKQVVLSLQDEEEWGYDDAVYYNLTPVIYDIIDILFEETVKPVLTTELYEIGE